MDGWVKIGTELDTKGVDKGLEKLEKELDKQKKIEFDMGKTSNEMDIVNAKIEQTNQKLEQAKQKVGAFPKWKLDTPDYTKAVSEVTSLNIKQDQLINKADELNNKYQLQNHKLIVIKSNIDNIKNSQNKISLKKVEDSLNKVGNKVDNVVSKIGKWAMAIFGIRTAYGLVQRAMGIISQHDDQIKTDTDYISFVLANSIKPLIEWLIQGAYTLLNYINYIAKAWFGVDLFAKATAEDFKKATKNAKELQKVTMGFDEMNIINESGGTGISTPSMDLHSPEDVKIPSWLQWIADHKDLVISGLLGISAGLIAVKFGLSGIKGLGIGLVIFGVVNLIKELIKYMKIIDSSLENNGTSWESFGKIIFWIGTIIIGLGILFLGLPAIIAGVVVTIVGLILSNWEKIREILSVAWNWIDDKLKWLEKNFGLLGELITNPIRIAVNTVKNLFEGMFTGIKQVFDGILLIFKGDFKNGFINIAKGIANLFITVINTMINGLNLAITPFRALIVAFGKVTGKNWTMDNIKIPTIKYLKTGGIINMPGKGVPVANNVRGGEAGREGVIPLTDSQAMETLGQAIGRYITINASITNNMDGKVIGREVKKIQGQQDFLMNR